MKKIALLCVLIFLINLSFAQETKEIAKKTDIPFSKEVYSVLKTDKKTQHGNYVKYDLTNRVLEKGQYELGKKNGVWEFYDWSGKLEQKYNFTDNKVEWNAPSEFKPGIQTEVDGQFIDVKPDQSPIFIGGQNRFNRFTYAAKYPVEARRNNTEGTVIISFIITSAGKMIDEKVEHGIGSGCDEAALTVFKDIPDEWIPAKHNGEPRNVKVFCPFKFKLD